MHNFARILGVLALASLALAGTASAATPTTTITSAGPLTSIFAGNELSCQVARAGVKQLYPETLSPGDCGTFAVYDSTLYKPDFSAHGGTATSNLGGGTVVALVSQTAVTGSGTSANPYKVVTVVTAGAKLRLTQTDTYVTGNDWWTTDVAVKNLTSSPLSTSIYRGMDCFLGGSDSGYGFLDAASGGAGCSAHANNSPVGLVEALVPAPGHTVRYLQAAYNAVWAAIGAKGNLANTCACASQIDNGVAVQWALSLTSQQTQVVSFNTVFDPAGSIPAPPPGLVPPSPTTTPTVDTTTAPRSGTAVVATPGTWDDPLATQAYQWQRCTSTAVSSCANVAGAATDTYTPGSGDVGNRLRLVQTATNSDGSADATSDMTPAVLGPAPVNATAPAVSVTDVPREGQPVTGARGTWTDAVSYVQRYQRCTSTDVTTCADIPGATALDYTPVANDAGAYLRLAVTATGPTGSTTAYSPLGDRVLPAPPVVVMPPGTASGSYTGEEASGPLADQDVTVGTELRPDLGTFAHASAMTFQFQRCATEDPGSCVDIEGATAATYTPIAADRGSRLRLVVVATNAGGSVTVATPMTRVVALSSEAPTVASPAPSARAACVSRRAVTLHWSVPADARVISYTVTLNGRRYAKLAAAHRGVKVRMNGRPAQRVVVAVTARTASGRKLATTRRYRTCAPSVPGATLKTLRLVPARA
jgi:hypothetical protein